MSKSKSNENVDLKSKSFSLISEIKTNHDNNHDITFSIGLSDISNNSNKKESNGTLEEQNKLINIINKDNFTLSIGGIENIEKMALDENTNEKKKLNIEMENENNSQIQSTIKESSKEESESKLLKNVSINSSENTSIMKEVKNRSEQDVEKILSEYNIDDIDKRIAEHLKAAEDLEKLKRLMIQGKLNKKDE